MTVIEKAKNKLRTSRKLVLSTTKMRRYRQRQLALIKASAAGASVTATKSCYKSQHHVKLWAVLVIPSEWEFHETSLPCCVSYSRAFSCAHLHPISSFSKCLVVVWHTPKQVDRHSDSHNLYAWVWWTTMTSGHNRRQLTRAGIVSQSSAWNPCLRLLRATKRRATAAISIINRKDKVPMIVAGEGTPR